MPLVPSVVAMLADQEYSVDSQVAAIQGERTNNAGKDWHVVVFGDVEANVVVACRLLVARRGAVRSLVVGGEVPAAEQAART